MSTLVAPPTIPSVSNGCEQLRKAFPTIPSVSEDYEQLRKAFEGWGTNEKLIFFIWVHRNAAQRKLIRQTYAETYGEDLLKALDKELTNEFERAVLLWALEPAELDALLANEATKTWTSTHQVPMEIVSHALLIEVCPQQEFILSFDKLEEGVVKDLENYKEEQLRFLNAMGDFLSPQIMLVKASIGNRELNVLIDSGSTLNFVDQNLTHSLGLPIPLTKEFNVTVANGESLVCNKIYKRVPITIQGYKFSTTLYVLPLSGPDLILGIQWLKTLGPVLCDWKKMTMEFEQGGVKYVIKSSSVNPSREAVHKLERDVQGGELFAIIPKGEDMTSKRILRLTLRMSSSESRWPQLKCWTRSGEYFEKVHLAINKQGTDEGALDHAIAKDTHGAYEELLPCTDRA